MKKRLLYVCPHLSTGGQPQYTLKQVQHFKNDFEIEVVEISNSGGTEYVVQKNKISALVPIHTLCENKSEILNIISKFNPDIIHFQEIPEHNLDTNILDEIFKKDRNYFIVVTTHGSFTNPLEIVYQPDRYVLVSEWSKKVFDDAELGVETMTWEYPIEQYSFDKEDAKKKLGLEKYFKHVLMVGLFSPGKNQSEIFKVARQLEKYKIKFHFVGNRALNYEHYWKPLIENVPPNCVIWGERTDVNTFYEACDLFYFSSVLELNPLSIKEALSYNMPSIFRKLHTYLDTYDNNPLVTYINDDLTQTKRIILEKLRPDILEIPGWFSYKTLYDEFIEKSPNNSVFVEVGTWFGKSTTYLANKIKLANKKVKLITVDTFKGTDNDKYQLDIVDSFGGDIFYEFIENSVATKTFDDIQIIKDSSENASRLFENASIDFLMLDAGESYNDVKNNIQCWFNKIKPGCYIAGDDYGISIFPGVTQVVNEYFYSQIQIDNWSWVRKKPRIQVIHMLTRPDDMRERVSIKSLKQLELYGITYTPVVNEVYDGFPPAENCRRPEHLSKDNKPGELYPGAGLGWITGRHYGCYLAHKKALELIDTKNFDYTLIFEADAFIYTGLEEFVDVIHKACFISERDDVYYISFANNPSREKIQIDNMFTKTAPNQDLAHAYLIPNRNKEWWMQRLNDVGWDVGDLWYNHVFYNHPKLRYTTNKIYSKQAEGYSLLDLTNKTWN